MTSVVHVVGVALTVWRGSWPGWSDGCWRHRKARYLSVFYFVV